MTWQYNIWNVTEVAPAYDRGENSPDSDGRENSATGRHGLAAGSRTVEEYTYGITTYGPSLTQVPPVHTSDRPGFGRSATSVAEGYGGTRQGSAEENSTGARIAHVSSPKEGNGAASRHFEPGSR